MRNLLNITAFALACIAAAQSTEKYDLSPKSKAGSQAKYKFVVKINDGDMMIRGSLQSKVTKVEDGSLSVEWTCPEMVQSQGGADAGDQVPPALNVKLDKHGMTPELSVSNGQAAYVAFGISNYLPATSLAVGDKFKIDWKGKNDGGTMSGNGELKEIKTEGGTKIAVIKSKIQMIPAGQTEPADLEITSEFNLSDMSLIKSTIKGTISEGNIDCSISLVK